MDDLNLFSTLIENHIKWKRKINYEIQNQIALQIIFFISINTTKYKNKGNYKEVIF